MGALIKNALFPLPLLIGGHQEHNSRAGTENVAGIAGLKTAELALRYMSSENQLVKGCGIA